LTRPRERMSQDFEFIFKDWARTREVVLATGSDYSKTVQQVPQEVLDLCNLVFCCMGNEVRNSDGVLIDKNTFDIPCELEEELKRFLDNSEYPEKVGRHLEYRTGMVNFSVVGRNANHEQRKRYNLWDKVNKERLKISGYINANYKEIESSVGGSISIDIIHRGSDKGQVISYLNNLKVQRVVFVGDRCFPGGNDYGIVREMESSDLVYEWFNVQSVQETMDLILNDPVFKKF